MDDNHDYSTTQEARSHSTAQHPSTSTRRRKPIPGIVSMKARNVLARRAFSKIRRIGDASEQKTENFQKSCEQNKRSCTYMNRVPLSDKNIHKTWVKSDVISKHTQHPPGSRHRRRCCPIAILSTLSRLQFCAEFRPDSRDNCIFAQSFCKIFPL